MCCAACSVGGIRQVRGSAMTSLRGQFEAQAPHELKRRNGKFVHSDEQNCAVASGCATTIHVPSLKGVDIIHGRRAPRNVRSSILLARTLSFPEPFAGRIAQSTFFCLHHPSSLVQDH